jgi:hypothetical protein
MQKAAPASVFLFALGLASVGLGRKSGYNVASGATLNFSGYKGRWLLARAMKSLIWLKTTTANSRSDRFILLRQEIAVAFASRWLQHLFNFDHHSLGGYRSHALMVIWAVRYGFSATRRTGQVNNLDHNDIGPDRSKAFDGGDSCVQAKGSSP